MYIDRKKSDKKKIQCEVSIELNKEGTNWKTHLLEGE
jgi:hypothetical protein